MLLSRFRPHLYFSSSWKRCSISSIDRPIYVFAQSCRANFQHTYVCSCSVYRSRNTLQRARCSVTCLFVFPNISLCLGFRFSFSNSRLSDSRFSNSRLADSRLSNSRLSDSRFSDSRLSNSRLLRVAGLRVAGLRVASLRGCRGSGTLPNSR